MEELKYFPVVVLLTEATIVPLNTIRLRLKPALNFIARIMLFKKKVFVVPYHPRHTFWTVQVSARSHEEDLQRDSAPLARPGSTHGHGHVSNKAFHLGW